jgi:hypothetical protein
VYFKHKIICFFQERQVETTKQKGKRRKKPHRPTKPVGQEGMPQYQHCPPAKHRGGKNPKYHEE